MLLQVVLVSVMLLRVCRLLANFTIFVSLAEKNSTQQQQIYLFFETIFYCNILLYITIQLKAINNDFSTIQVQRITSLCIKLIFNK